MARKIPKKSSRREISLGMKMRMNSTTSTSILCLTINSNTFSKGITITTTITRMTKRRWRTTLEKMKRKSTKARRTI